MNVSVVIPLYNKEAYVARALEGVLGQTHQDFEVIVVDDGSTDAGAEVVRRCPDPRVRLVPQPNGGVSVARNRGVEEAASDWVAFLDADDEWLPGFLEQAVRAAQAFPPAVAVFTNYRDSATLTPFLRAVPPAPAILDDYFRFCLRNGGAGIHSSAVLVRRDALRAAGGFPPGVAIGEDRDTWCRLAWTGDVAVVPEVLAVYNTGLAGGAMARSALARAQRPPIPRTFAAWEEQGRVPARMRDGSADFVNWVLLEYVGYLAKANLRREAWNVLRRECRFHGPARKFYLKMALTFVIPPGLLSWAKRTRNRVQFLRQSAKSARPA